MVRKRFMRVLVFVLVGLGFLTNCYALKVPSNGPQQPPPDSSDYTIIMSGHWYGAHGNDRSIYPAASIWANLPKLRAANPSLVVALGDVVRNPLNASEVAGFHALANQIGVPMMHVLGNHDHDVEAIRNNSFGEFFDAFERNGNLFLFLNTEWIASGGCQPTAQMIEDWQGREIKNVFVFSHHLLWALTEPGFKEMDEYANATYANHLAADSAQILYNSVIDLAGKNALYWFSGDVGTAWSFPVFADHSLDGKRHFYAAGIGDSDEDVFLKLYIQGNGDVETSILPLSNKQWEPLSTYDLNFWRKEVPQRRTAQEPTFSQKVSKALASKKLWAGFVLGAFAMGIVGFLFGRMKKKKTV